MKKFRKLLTKRSKLIIALMFLAGAAISFFLIFRVSADGIKLAVPPAEIGGYKSTSSVASIDECKETGKTLDLHVQVRDKKTKTKLSGKWVGLASNTYSSSTSSAKIGPNYEKTGSDGYVTFKIPVLSCVEKNKKTYYYSQVGVGPPFKTSMNRKVGAVVVDKEYSDNKLSKVYYTSSRMYPIAKSQEELKKISWLKPINIYLENKAATVPSSNTVKVKTVNKGTGSVASNAQIELVVNGSKCVVKCSSSQYSYRFRTGSNGEAVVDLNNSGLNKQILSYPIGKITTIEFKNAKTGETLSTIKPGTRSVTIKL